MPGGSAADLARGGTGARANLGLTAVTVALGRIVGEAARQRAAGVPLLSLERAPPPQPR